MTFARTGVFSIAFLVALAACDSKISYIELPMAQRNPVSYTFNASISETHEAMRTVRDTLPVLSFQLATDSSVIADEILRANGNEWDAVIVPSGASTSLIYQTKERPLWYFYELHLHLQALDSNKTVV